MVDSPDKLWPQFLQPLVDVLIDQKQLRQLYESIDWQRESDRLSTPELVYPDYYQRQNFHGIEGGYLNAGAATTYDPITQYALPPNETWVRQELVDCIQGTPRKILDLGCGTGSTTLLLKQAFPQAEVIGLDLSPYMLVMAERKARAAGVEIQWRHGKAEETGLPKVSFDLVTACLLFHETPPAVATLILRESFRLLKGGGQVLILDGNQQTLRQVNWLTEVFEEPYIKAYATDSVDAWMGSVGFEAVQTQDVWWLHQVTQGMKPLPVDEQVYHRTHHRTIDDFGSPGIPAPA